jgi:hypothetical protein
MHFLSEFAKQHPGILLVIIGVLGEGLEIFFKLRDKIIEKKRSKKFEVFLECWGAFFWILLIVGLVLEMREAGKTDDQLSANETKASMANERAANLENIASSLNNSNLILAAQLETLKKDAVDAELEVARLERENDFLEKHSKPMWLQVNATELITELKNEPKGTAEIFFLDDDQNANLFAFTLSGYFKTSGWTVPSPKPISFTKSLKLGCSAGITLRAMNADEMCFIYEKGTNGTTDLKIKNDTPFAVVYGGLVHQGIIPVNTVKDGSLNKETIQIVIGQKVF